MKVICYVRPWNKNTFHAIAKKAFPNASVTTISDFKGVGSAPFQELYQKLDDLPPVKELGKDLSSDVIIRCRLLRELPLDKSQDLVNNYWKIIHWVFDQNQPNLVLSLTVDSYVIDLIRIYCEQNQVPFFGFVVSFIKNHFRLTNRGEKIQLSKPTDEDIQEVYESLVIKKVKPEYMAGKLGKNENLVFLKNRFKNLVKFLYFKIKRIFSDSVCYHYWSNELITSKSINIIPEKVPYINEWSRIDRQGKTIVFIPLQYYPEATIDYWTSSVKLIEFEKTLKNISESIDDDTLLYVKEHPAVIGLRPDGFYKRMKQLKNTNFIPSNVNSIDLIEYCDVTLVWTGTAGFEAALMGKPVICLTKPYYFDDKKMSHLVDVSDIQHLLNELKKKDTKIDTNEQKRLISSVLESNLRGQFLNPKKKNGRWLDSLEDIDTVSDSIRRYYINTYSNVSNVK